MKTPASRVTQPGGMRTRSYLAVNEKINGNDLWALFKACMFGDESKVERLIGKDPRLVRGIYWYQSPVHQAARNGHAKIVRLLSLGRRGLGFLHMLLARARA